MARFSTRNGWRWWCVGLFAALVTLYAVRDLDAATPNEKPLNFVVMLADDIGAKELACYGHPTHKTPNLDALAATGVMFKTAYVTPICHPTRFEIMTGQYGYRNGIFQFAGRPGGPKPDDPAEQITNHVTFGQVMQAAGYATAHAGKWQLSGKLPTLVREAGFDEYCMWAYRHNLPEGVVHKGGYEDARKSKTSRYWHPSIVKNGEYLPTGPNDYGPDIFSDFVVDFIRRHKDEPFFVYYPMALTHAPYYTTPDSTKGPEDHFINKRENFADNVAYLDKIVGKVVRALDELGLRENTIVMFIGDNGTGGDGKAQPTELGARVPFIVNCPGIVKPLGPVDALVDGSDVFPTLVDMAGAKVPPEHRFDGISFAPILRGEAEKTRDWIFSYIGPYRIVRTERWLLERNTMTSFGRLYDCGDCRDGSSYKDVTDSNDPEVLAAKALMKKILADKPSPIVEEASGTAASKSDVGKKSGAAQKKRQSKR